MNTYFRRFLTLVCGVTLAIMAVTPVFAASSVGHVSYLNGEVQVLRGDKPLPLQLNDLVYPTDVVVTEASGRAKIDLNEGSVIFVGSKSRISIDEYVIDKGKLTTGSFNMLWGKVRFAVSKLKAKGSSFSVKTATATIGVRGTVFTVSVPEPTTGIPAIKLPENYTPPKLGTKVLLLEGAVIAKAIGGLQKTMKPGQIANIPKSGLIAVRKVRPADLKNSDVNVKTFAPGAATEPEMEDPGAAASVAPKVKKPDAEEPKAKRVEVKEPKVKRVEVEEPKVKRVKVEEPKVKRVKVEEPKVKRVKVEAPKVERVKVERVKVEAPKVETVRVEAPKVETVRVEAPKVETVRVEAPKVETVRVEAPKVETVRVEAPAIKAPIIEAPKVEAPKIEAVKFEAPKIEEPKIETWRYEGSKYRD